MTEYEAVDQNIEEVGEFDGDTEHRPKFRCSKCSLAIQKEYTSTSGVCYLCNNGQNMVGENINQVHAVSVYVSDSVNTDLMDEIYELKDDHKHIEKMAQMLEWGINDSGLADFDLIVTPPSGEADSESENHMVPVGERVSDLVGIPFKDITYKREDYESQKGLSRDERIENISGKIGCEDESLSADRIIVIDDIATSCATLSETARAVIETGAEEVEGLVIARDEDIQNLKFANVIQEV